MKTWRKTVSIVSTLALLLNSLAAPLSVLAQEATPSPTPEAAALPTDTPTPTDVPTTTPEATDSTLLTASPTAQPDATPAEVATPTPEITPTGTDLVTPTPSDQPIETQDPESSPTVQGPPTNDQAIQSTSTPTPTATPVFTSTPEPENNAAVTTTVVSSDLFPSTVQDNTWIKLITDKLDYSPTEMAIISGSGFTPSETYSLTVASTDDPATTTTVNVIADGNGNFTYDYQLDGNYRPNYSVDVKNGETVIASTSFTDSTTIENGSFEGENAPQNSNSWTTGNISGYKEGDTIKFKLALTSTAAGIGHLFVGFTSSSTCPFFAYQLPTDVSATGGFSALLGSTITRSGSDAIADFTISTTTVSSGYLNFKLQLSDRAASCGSGSSQHVEINDANGDIKKGGKQSLPIPSDANTVAPVTDVSITKSGPSTASINELISYTLTARNNDTYTQAGSIVVTDTLPTGITFTSGSWTKTNPVGSGSCSAIGQIVTCNIGSLAGGGTSTITINGQISNSLSLCGATLTNNASISTTTLESNSTNNSASASTSISSCQATPTVVTNIHNASGATVTSVPAGTIVHDSASVSGSNGIATGNVTFGFFNNSVCTGTPAATSSNFALSSGVVDATTFTQGPLSAGSYSFKAHYAGDSNYYSTDGTCETLSVTRLSPSISTILSVTTANIGDNINDSSTLTGATSNAGGTVTYHAYAGANTCSGTDLLNNQVTVTNGDIPNSSNISFANAGTYSFQAVYSGDTNNNGATSVCSTEQITIGKNSPTISTILSSSSNNVGGSVHDTATLSGATPNAGGTVIYNVYSNNTCTNLVAGPGIKSVTNGVVPNSDDITFTNSGDYYWQATYSGDTNNNGATSLCTDEHLVVNKVTPAITTIASNGGVVGIQIHDSATLSGGYNPTGDITFRLYQVSDTSCSLSPILVSTKSLSGLSAGPSDNYTTNSVGTYNWRATYNGDSNNNDITSVCSDEPVTTTKASPGITTDLSSVAVSIGDNVHDLATLTSMTSDAGGNVIYSVYSGNSCSGTPVFSDTQSVTNGEISDSTDFTPGAAGTYNWQAVYSGDAKNEGATSTCETETLTVGKNSPSIATVLSSSNINVGGSIFDSATLSGTTSNAGGSVTYNVYSDSSCSHLVAGPGAKTVSNGIVPNSNDVTFTSAGDYYWQANYSGDDNNIAAESTCTEEHLVVGKVSPTLNTLPDPTTAVLGASIRDTATLSEGFNPTGTIAFSLYDPDNTTCAVNERMWYESVSVDGNDTYSTTAFNNTIKAGTWRWVASYSGDSNNNGVTGNCSDELVTIDKADTGVTTHVHNATHESITNTAVSLGTVIHDNSTVSGQVGVIGMTGNVTYDFYDNSVCEGPALGSETVSLGTESSSITNLGAGSYSYKASYGGDRNYNTSTGICEPFTVSEPLRPNVSITKSNDKSGGTTAGSIVTYTLIITNSGSVDLNNVLITDFLPGGFTYVNGSSNGATFINAIGPKLTWTLDSLGAQSSATITYQVTTDSGLSDGDYKNFARCSAFYGEGSSISCEQVDSTVKIGHGASYSGSLGGQVLGASTELPDTGSPTAILIIALGLLTAGFILKKYAKN